MDSIQQEINKRLWVQPKGLTSSADFMRAVLEASQSGKIISLPEGCTVTRISEVRP